jgi:hypothetical protein
MDAINRVRSEFRSARSETIPHHFDLGQAVRLKGDLLERARRVEVYQVVGKLPPLGELPQYRIRSEAEPYDRVTTEDRLELATATGKDQRSLTAKVFSKV